MLVKYREELTRPIDEAMEFLKRVEAQLDSISGGGGSSSSARLSLTGKISSPHHRIGIGTTAAAGPPPRTSCCLLAPFLFLFLLSCCSYMAVVRRPAQPGVFIYIGVGTGLPHWVWLILDSGGGCSGSLPL